MEINMNKHHNKSYILKASIIASLFATLNIGLTSCNTFEGIGDDLSAGGRALSKAAHKYNPTDKGSSSSSSSSSSE